ncbi:DUF3794 and LysM peptidoglycan-binding domain-containing protein [Sinanaerobacter sp. ZZT-01]|uniref:DUF3794 and LysM peptidoglycan-binding domain-containing protein n=1 Tax=Sinanaerobacter sp. ZZT-01 TaxID=3111540 RepID=UPI002D780F01|nr:SPOCS domain-containing protein [Sinanaerobacter sp. ZZT-01]WRR94843.1 SPOCS domain-containing protein [Sinanaerobacter sp. ZZT-01]
MAYEKDPYDFDKIPDFALKPARPKNELPLKQKTPMPIDNAFDPSVYDRLFYDLPAISPKTVADMKAAAGKPISEREKLEMTGEKEKGTEQSKDEEKQKENSLKKEEAESSIKNSIGNVQESIDAETVMARELDAKLDDKKENIEDEVKEAASKKGTASETVANKEEKLTQEAVEKKEEVVTETAEEAMLETAREKIQISPTVPSAIIPQTLEEKKIERPAEAPKEKPSEKPIPHKVQPVDANLLSRRLKITDVKSKPQFRVFIEEDILVPDVKPDLASILSMDGKLKLSDKQVSAGASGVTDLKISGDFMLQTLYIPDKTQENELVVAIDSRLPFKEKAEIRAEPYSELIVTPMLEAIDYSVVNERKFRVKATVGINVKEYRAVDVQIFEGIQGEEVQLLKEKIHATDVALRKTEAIELEEDLPLKDSMPEIGKILRYDVNVVENHKQVSRDKAVINATVYCNVMYLGAEPFGGDIESMAEEGEEDTQKAIPVFYQGKTDFTQFIKLEEDTPDSAAPSGSSVSFAVANASVKPKEDENGQVNSFTLELTADTTIEVYKDTEQEIVTDVYHHIKEMQYDTDEISLMNLCGMGNSEVSAREIINVPEKYGGIDRVVFLSGNIGETTSHIEAGKNIVEGAVTLKIICIGMDENKTPFSIKQDLPFRSSIDIPGIKSEMVADNEVVLKELWYDKMNQNQIEVNAGISVSSSVMDMEKHALIKNVCFVELPEQKENQPSMVLYITKAGDNIWKIAKKYRTTIEAIKKINSIDYSNDIKPGTKLLIVK